MWIVLCLSRKIAKMSNCFGGIRCDCTTATGCNNLIPIKTIAAKITNSSCVFPGILPFGIVSTQGFCSIFDNLDIETLSSFHNGFHVSHISKDMYNHKCLYCFFLISQFLPVPHTCFFTETLQFHWIHTETIITINEHRCSELIFHRVYGSNKC